MSKLRPYQEKAVEFLTKRRRAVLGSEMRTGKTAVAIQAAETIYSSTKHDGTFAEHIFAIVPANVKYTFAKQILEWGEYHAIQVIDEGKEKIDVNSVWIIMSYQIAIKKLPLLTQAPIVAVLDEAHKVKSLKAKTTQVLIGEDSLLRKTRATWLLTGTPFPNNLIDCYPLFNFCLYGKLGKYWAFANTHCYIKDSYFGKKIYGCKKETLPQLTETVRNILHRDTLEAVWKEMPARQDITITLEHTTRSLDICANLDHAREVIQVAIAEGREFRPPELMSQRKDLAIEKIPQAAAFILDTLAQVRPIVVCARHLDLIHGIEAAIRGECSTAIIEGATSAKDREAIRAKFQAGGIDCLIISIQAGGEGIDLSAADTMIIAEEEWTPKDMAQVKARIISMGKHIPLTYYYLMFPDSLDESVHQSLLAKERSIKSFWNSLENREDAGVLEIETQEEINWEF